MTEEEKTPEVDETDTAPNAEPQAPAAAEETVDETVPAAAADDAPEEPAAEPEAPAKPKRTRAKKAAPKAAADEDAEASAEDAVADEPAADADAEAPAEKPKPRRSRAKKTEEPPAEEAKPKAEPKRLNGDRPVVRAQAKYVRTSARKARLVCDHIRGKSVDEARAILAHTPRAVAEDWIKLLESAVANAEHNHELLGDDLKIHKVFADEGPTLKRFRPRAMGRATRIRKRTSHLTIQLTTKE